MSNKTLFNEILAAIMEALKLKAPAIVKGDGNWVTADAVRRWKTQEKPPSSENVDILIDRIIDATSAEKAQSFCARISEFNNKSAEIWSRHGVDARNNTLSASDSFDDIIKTLLTVAFENNDNKAEKSRGPVRRLVAFDLDGTLIKGIRYSWTVLWNAIGKTAEEATEHQKDFERGEYSYEDWCKSDSEVLRAGGLTMQKVADAAKKCGCRVTQNLREAVDLLHKNNCRVVIISGGADCLLKAVMPDAAEIFDEICINRCIFGSDGVIEKIIPTDYDWDKHCLGVQGKEAGFRLLCAKHGAREEDSVFVGDDRNDFGAMKLAGMRIFYPGFTADNATRGITEGARPRDWPDKLIMEGRDDLMVVAKRIVDWRFED